MTTIIVLAAGSSSRLGQPKQLLPYRNTTLIEHCLNQVKDLDNSEVLVVLGSHYSEIKARINGVRTLNNTDWEQGMGTGIAMAVKKVIGKSDRILITLCDLPLITRQDYLKLLSCPVEKDQIFCSNYTNEIKGVPALFGRKYFEQLTYLEGDSGAREIIQNNTDQVNYINLNKDYVDIDTIEDYHKILKL